MHISAKLECISILNSSAQFEMQMNENWFCKLQKIHLEYQQTFKSFHVGHKN